MSTTQNYTHQFDLKYGCNPQQQPAHISSIGDKPLPFTVLNGRPGYINLLDAINAWQLVQELRESLNITAAASFKHVSPAGAGLAVPLSDALREAYEMPNADELTPAALAYLRARNADPKSSFGDFAALSDRVDKATAAILKTSVSDGIIAPGFDEDALEILKQKKGGKFIILQADPTYSPPEMEYREIHGVVFAQKRNDTLITPENAFTNISTENKNIPEAARRDLVLAAITIKYTQSNSVGYALDGQMIGVGAGQQSRVDCVKLAGKKAEVWALRQHPKVLALEFKKGVKKVGRTNARIQYIEGSAEMTGPEKAQWLTNFDEEPVELTDAEKREFLNNLSGVSLFSDAFFPFRDNIDQASKRGVSYILQPGGSVQDETVIKACGEYDMAMSFNGVRVFHH